MTIDLPAGIRSLIEQAALRDPLVAQRVSGFLEGRGIAPTGQATLVVTAAQIVVDDQDAEATPVNDTEHRRHTG